MKHIEDKTEFNEEIFQDVLNLIIDFLKQDDTE